MGRENKLELKRIQNFNLDHLRFAHGLEITNATSGFWLYTVYVLRVDWLSNPLCSYLYTITYICLYKITIR
ncbi:Uncharacterised protein [Mycobacteroides abscessus subsp. massiliense]|nr:Uncharacterised protein [Mycobacteroides abscessus subsp. massiliense]